MLICLCPQKIIKATINHQARLLVTQKAQQEEREPNFLFPTQAKIRTFSIFPHTFLWKMADSENNGDKPNKATVGEPPELPPPSAPHDADVENPSSSSTVVISSIIDRWKREDLLMKGNLVLRASAFVFSLISFVVMASNKHGDWMNFDRYEEYRWFIGSIGSFRWI